ncbi:MAG: class I SAM-dependent methyltransferase [Candidatus Omnitrophota bacterium]
MSDKSKNEIYYNSLDVNARQRHRDIVYDKRSLGICEDIIGSIIQRIKVDEPIRWLDVGCGVGRSCEILKKISAIYTGVDISEANIQACSRKYNHNFLCGDFITMPIEEKFHLVTFFSSLHHFPDWKAAIEKALSLIDKKGALYIEHEPMRLVSKLYLYSLHMRYKPGLLTTLRDIEIHNMAKPTILPKELPEGSTQYHSDFVPFFRKLNLRTTNSTLGYFFPHYRKIIIIDKAVK